MNEREKRILTTICTALPYMDDFSKGYLLATAEIFAKEKQKKREEKASLMITQEGISSQIVENSVK